MILLFLPLLLASGANSHAFDTNEVVRLILEDVDLMLEESSFFLEKYASNLHEFTIALESKLKTDDIMLKRMLKLRERHGNQFPRTPEFLEICDQHWQNNNCNGEIQDKFEAIEEQCAKERIEFSLNTSKLETKLVDTEEECAQAKQVMGENVSKLEEKIVVAEQQCSEDRIQLEQNITSLEQKIADAEKLCAERRTQCTRRSSKMRMQLIESENRCTIRIRRYNRTASELNQKIADAEDSFAKERINLTQITVQLETKLAEVEEQCAKERAKRERTNSTHQCANETNIALEFEKKLSSINAKCEESNEKYRQMMTNQVLDAKNVLAMERKQFAQNISSFEQKLVEAQNNCTNESQISGNYSLLEALDCESQISKALSQLTHSAKKLEDKLAETENQCGKERAESTEKHTQLEKKLAEKEEQCAMEIERAQNSSLTRTERDTEDPCAKEKAIFKQNYAVLEKKLMDSEKQFAKDKASHNTTILKKKLAAVKKELANEKKNCVEASDKALNKMRHRERDDCAVTTDKLNQTAINLEKKVVEMEKLQEQERTQLNEKYAILEKKLADSEAKFANERTELTQKISELEKNLTDTEQQYAKDLAETTSTLEKKLLDSEEQCAKRINESISRDSEIGETSTTSVHEDLDMQERYFDEIVRKFKKRQSKKHQPYWVTLPSPLTAGHSLEFSAKFLPSQSSNDPNDVVINLSHRAKYTDLHQRLSTDGKLTFDVQTNDEYHNDSSTLEYATVPIVQGDIFKCRVRNNATGFEIRYNGHFTHFYKHRLPASNIIKYIWLQHNVKLFDYRVQEDMHVPYTRKFTEPFKFGDFIYINGISRGDFGLLVKDKNGTLDDNLQFSIESSTIARQYAERKESYNSTLQLNTEFEILIANKPKGLEYYVDGQLLEPVIPHKTSSEALYQSLVIEGEIDLFEVARSSKAGHVKRMKEEKETS